jgi:hypothetical protein
MRKSDGSNLPFLNKLQWDFFGINPARIDPDNREDIDTKGLTVSDKFVAQKHKQALPVYPVHTDVEKYLYKILLRWKFPAEFSILQQVDNGADKLADLHKIKISERGWDAIAKLWNSGGIPIEINNTIKFKEELNLYKKHKGPGATAKIYPKSDKQLEHFFKTSIENSVKKVMLVKVDGALRRTQEAIALVHSEFSTAYTDSNQQPTNFFNAAQATPSATIVMKQGSDSESAAPSSSPVTKQPTTITSLAFTGTSTPSFTLQVNPPPETPISTSKPLLLPFNSTTTSVPPPFPQFLASLNRFSEPQPTWETKKRKRDDKPSDTGNKRPFSHAPNITPNPLALSLCPVSSTLVDTVAINISLDDNNSGKKKRRSKTCSYAHCTNPGCSGGMNRELCSAFIAVREAWVCRKQAHEQAHERLQQFHKAFIQTLNVTAVDSLSLNSTSSA